METQSVTMSNSQTFVLRSQKLDRDFKIFVSLPYSYGMSEEEPGPFTLKNKWPVVYLLDANLYFEIVAGMVRTMSWDGRTSDAILVGIGYPEKSQNPRENWRDVFVSRALDLTPCRDEKFETETAERFNRSVLTGGADGFHSFIQTELIPLIELEYQADSTMRILSGHSLGGLFGTYALLKRPQLFKSYIIGSPSLFFRDKYLFEYEEIIAKKRKQLRAKVYFSVGELEEVLDFSMVSNMIRLISLLENRQYKGLTLKKRIFWDQDHCEVIGQGFHSGLKWALRN